MSNEIVDSICIKRIIKDLKNLDNENLNNNNIYYSHDENNIMRGYIMIIGPSETIYENGFYFFDIIFTNEYPFKPPKVIYKTNDGVTRFHPNLYRNGKVCLSLLNTWNGESWSSCQSLTTILLTLVTLFTNKSLLNEPGINEKYASFIDYHNIIEYKNIYHSIFHYLKPENIEENFKIFYPIIIESFNNNKDKIYEKINKKIANPPKKYNYINLYDMSLNIDYKILLSNFNLIIKKIEK